MELSDYETRSFVNGSVPIAQLIPEDVSSIHAINNTVSMTDHSGTTDATTIYDSLPVSVGHNSPQASMHYSTPGHDNAREYYSTPTMHNLHTNAMQQTSSAAYNSQLPYNATPVLPNTSSVDPMLMQFKQEAIALGFLDPSVQCDYILRKLQMQQSNVPHPPQVSIQSPKIRMSSWKPNVESWEVFIHKFERYSRDLKWDESSKLLHLVSCLEGKALSIYRRIDSDKVASYAELRSELEKAFSLTAEQLGNAFNSASKNSDESATQFAANLKEKFLNWYKKANGSQSLSQDGLLNHVIREQFLKSLPKELKQEIKQRKLIQIAEIAVYAENYFEARTSSCKQEDKLPDAPVKEHPKFPVNNALPQTYQRNHIDFRSRKYKTNKHSFREYPNKVTTGRNAATVAAAVEAPGSRTNLGIESNVKVQAPATVVSKTQSKSKSNDGRQRQARDSPTSPLCPACSCLNNKLHLAKGQVNGKDCTVMRDPGSVVSIVANYLVQTEQKLDKFVDLQLVNGFKCRHRVANINVSSPYYDGVLEACVMDSPPFDLIIGNVNGDDLCPKAMVSDTMTSNTNNTALAVTRAQSRDRQVSQSGKRLVISDVGEILADPKMEILQKEDPSLQRLFKLADAREERTRGNKTSKFILSRGLLYRQVVTRNGDRQVKSTKQLVVPAVYKPIVFKLAHAAPLAGHQGKSKTLNRVQNHFFWPSMTEEINRWTASCDVCQKTTDKGRVKPAPLVNLPIMGEPFQRCAIDLVGPIVPASSDGYRYMLVLTDFATKWPEAIPLKSITTHAVAEALLNIFTRVGVPKEILSDRGSQFTGDMMKEVYRLMAVRGLYTTPYHPQCNGACERLNGVLKKMLKRLCAEQPKLWPKFINPLLFAYREAEHRATGFSPFFLMYGRNVRGPLHILKESLEGDVPRDEETRTAYQYVLELQERISQTLKLANDELKKAGIKSAKYCNRKSKLRDLKPGDKCLLLLPNSENKLIAQWQGPYDITGKKSDVVFTINVKGQNKNFHINMLKKYFEYFPTCGVNTGLTSSKQNYLLYNMSELIRENLSEIVVGRRKLLEVVPQFYGAKRLACAVIPANQEPGQMIMLDKTLHEDVKIGKELSPHQRRKVMGVLKKYEEVFTDCPRPAKVEPCRIQITDRTPVRSKPYGIPHKLLDRVKKEVADMEMAGYLEPSTSPYASPIVVVRKPDSSIRICGDFRKINAHIQFDAEPMADQRDIFSRLSKSYFFSKMDLAKGFYQLPLDEESKPYTAVATPLGLKQFTVVPFGLSISPAVFNRTIRRILHGIAHVEIFVDDLLIHTQSWEEHLRVVQQVLLRFKSYGISVKPSKCELGARSVEFLGHYIGHGIQKPQPRTVEKIENFTFPETKKGMQSFLGLCNYYSEFIPGYTLLAQPLIATICKKAPKKIVWTQDLQQSFLAMKQALNQHSVLYLPDVDKPFILQTDASGTGIGVALLQKREDGESPKPIAFWSRKLTPAETRYATIERECLAIIEGVKKFHSYLYGSTFDIETDHQPLSYLRTYSATNKNGRLTRWSLFLQDYSFNITYIKGGNNILADKLSRMHPDECSVSTNTPSYSPLPRC